MNSQHTQQHSFARCGFSYKITKTSAFTLDGSNSENSESIETLDANQKALQVPKMPDAPSQSICELRKASRRPTRPTAARRSQRYDERNTSRSGTKIVRRHQTNTSRSNKKDPHDKKSKRTQEAFRENQPKECTRVNQVPIPRSSQRREPAERDRSRVQARRPRQIAR